MEQETSTPECKLILKNCFYFCDWFFHSLTHSKSLEFCADLGRRGRREVAHERDREQISVRTTSLGGGRQLELQHRSNQKAENRSFPEQGLQGPWPLRNVRGSRNECKRLVCPGLRRPASGSSSSTNDGA